MKKLKFSEWCDKIKDNHKFCVDEQSTELEFITKLALSYFVNERGCSTLDAAGFADCHFKKIYDEISERVKYKIDKTIFN
jgi:hypothetical protein